MSISKIFIIKTLSLTNLSKFIIIFNYIFKDIISYKTVKKTLYILFIISIFTLPFLGPAGFFYLFIIFLMSIAVLYAIGPTYLRTLDQMLKLRMISFSCLKHLR